MRLSATIRKGGSPDGERKPEDQFGIRIWNAATGSGCGYSPGSGNWGRGEEFDAERATERVRESIEDIDREVGS